MGHARSILIAGIAAMAGAVLPPPSFGAAPPIVESQPLPRPGAAAPSAPGQSAPAAANESNQIVMELYSRVEALQREVQELRGALEVQEHRGSSLEQRQRELYIDIDRRLRRMEEAAAASAAAPGTGGQDAAISPPAPTPAPVPVPVPQASPTAPAPAASADGQAERQAYERAFDIIKAGRYEEAVTEFRSFLARYPGSTYSANAQYWLGEANYVMRQFEDAAVEFDKVLKFYPDSSKAADAMLKLGFSQYELQRWSDAAATLQQVIERYPASTARQLAEGRLQRMRMEGR